MILHKNIPNEFWAEALSAAAYIRNRVTSKSLAKNTTLFHLWYGKAPDVAHLRVFGSRCWYKINAPGVDSLASRAKEAIMLGYATNKKSYKLWDVSKGEITVSRDVGDYNEDSSDNYEEQSGHSSSDEEEDPANTSTDEVSELSEPT